MVSLYVISQPSYENDWGVGGAHNFKYFMNTWLEKCTLTHVWFTKLCAVYRLYTEEPFSSLIFSKLLPFIIYSWTKNKTPPCLVLWIVAAQLTRHLQTPFHHTHLLYLPLYLRRSEGQQKWKRVFFPQKRKSWRQRHFEGVSKSAQRSSDLELGRCYHLVGKAQKAKWRRDRKQLRAQQISNSGVNLQLGWKHSEKGMEKKSKGPETSRLLVTAHSEGLQPSSRTCWEMFSLCTKQVSSLPATVSEGWAFSFVSGLWETVSGVQTGHSVFRITELFLLGNDP